MTGYIIVDTALRRRRCHLCNGKIYKGEKCLFVGGQIAWQRHIHKNVCKSCMSDIISDTPIVDRERTETTFHTNPNTRNIILARTIHHAPVRPARTVTQFLQEEDVAL